MKSLLRHTFVFVLFYLFSLYRIETNYTVFILFSRFANSTINRMKDEEKSDVLSTKAPSDEETCPCPSIGTYRDAFEIGDEDERWWWRIERRRRSYEPGDRFEDPSFRKRKNARISTQSAQRQITTTSTHHKFSQNNDGLNERVSSTAFLMPRSK